MVEKGNLNQNGNDVVDEFFTESGKASVVGANRTEKLASENSEFVRRRRLATTAIAALGVLAAACAILAFARERWATFGALERGAIVFGSLAALYAIAGTARRFGETPFSNLMFLGGSAFFGAGIVLLGEKNGFAGGVEASSFCLWSLGSFALAASLTSSTLHYLTSLATLCWVFTGDNAARFPTAFALCTVGEYWAWRRKSPSVAAIYFGVAVVAATQTSGGGSWEYAPFGGAAVGIFLYWFGATFRSAIVRGIGLVVGTASLAIGSLPEFWAAVRVEAETSGADGASMGLSATICLILFVAVACGMLLEGARRSVARFVFAVSTLLIWLVWQAFSSLSSLGTAVALAVVALGIFALLFFERRLRLRAERQNEGKRGRVGATPTTDATTDDEEFDDFFDAEARAAANAPPLLAILSALDEWREQLEKRLRVPGVLAAIVVQFAILFSVFWIGK